MFGARAIRTIEGHAPLEAAFGILRDAGLDRDSALDAFLSMSSFVLGFVLIDMGGMRQVADGRALAPEELAELAADSRPRLVELGEALGNGDTTRVRAGLHDAARRPPPPHRTTAPGLILGLITPDPAAVGSAADQRRSRGTSHHA